MAAILIPQIELPLDEPIGLARYLLPRIGVAGFGL